VVKHIIAEGVKKKLYILNQRCDSVFCISPPFGTLVKLAFVRIAIPSISIISTSNKTIVSNLFITL